MDGIGTASNFSNRAYRSVQHDCIASHDAQLAKVIRQFFYRVHCKLSLTGSQPLDSGNASNAV
jgi:hypothetical protein